MRNVGLLLIIFGGIILAGGSVAAVVNLTSSYAPTICERASNDKQKSRDARMLCKDTSSDCYRRTVAGLTDDSECSAAKSFQLNSVLISAAAAAVGFFTIIVGIFLRRKKREPALA